MRQGLRVAGPALHNIDDAAGCPIHARGADGDGDGVRPVVMVWVLP